MLHLNKSVIYGLLFSIILIDLLVFPYLQFVILPAGLALLILPIVFLKINIRYDNDIIYITIITSCAILSTFISIFRPSANVVMVDNMKYLLQLTTTFLYYISFKWYGRQTWSRDKYIIYPLYFFVLWYLYLVILFLNAPLDTIYFIKDMYGRTTVDLDDFLNDFRFPYLFSDPNTSIYFFLMVVGFLFHQRPNYFHLGLLFFGGGLATFVSQSTGGGIVWLVMLVTAYFISTRSLSHIKSAIFVTITASLALILALFIYNSSDNFHAMINIALERFFDEDRGKSGGGRLNHWSNLFSMYPLPLGRGFLLFDEGVIKPPHSDLLGLSFRYGTIAAVSFFIFLFGSKKRLTIFSIAALMPFLINALVEDQKMLGLYFVFIGYISNSNYFFNARHPQWDKFVLKRV